MDNVCRCFPVSHRDTICFWAIKLAQCHLRWVASLGELNSEPAVTQLGPRGNSRMSTHLPGTSSTHHFTPAQMLSAAALSPRFTNFPDLSPFLGEGEPQSLHAATLLPLGCCFGPGGAQFLSTLCSQQLPAFIYKLSPMQDKPRGMLEYPAPHPRMFLTAKPNHPGGDATLCPIFELLPWSSVNGTADAIHFPWGIDSSRFIVAKKKENHQYFTVSHQPSRGLCSRCKLISCMSPSAPGTSQP